ncbi:MAG: nucleotidyltransferase family protein [Alphaproteobacteria bacterium]
MRAPDQAIVLAAGLGTRLRPVTEELPKPLVAVAGETLIDRILDRLVAAGITRAVVNTHHMAERLEAHLAARPAPRIEISREDELLETGGGVAKAMAKLKPAPFYAINGDVLWLDGTRSALKRLAEAWREGDMDALLLVHPVARAGDYRGTGDFLLDQLGRMRRRKEKEIAPFVFTGIQLLHPRLFEDAPQGPFSLNRLYDRAEAAGRLHGIVHGGEWFHVGTPENLAWAEAELAGGNGPGKP